MDVEEVILFPDHPPPPAAAPAPGEGPSGLDAEEAFTKLRAWIGVQLTTAEGQLRNHKEPPKPDGVTPAIAAYMQAREAKAALKATREAYMKARQKAAE